MTTHRRFATAVFALAFAALAPTGALAGGGLTDAACWSAWTQSPAHALNRCLDVDYGVSGGSCGFTTRCMRDAFVVGTHSSQQPENVATTTWNGSPDYTRSLTLCDGAVRPSC